MDLCGWVLVFAQQAILSGLGTSLVALKHGHSPRPYLGLAVVLGLGAIPLTYLMILHAEPLGPRLDANGFNPSRSPETERMDSSVDPVDENAALELASWAKFSTTFHRVLMSTALGVSIGCTALIAGVFEFVLPRYVDCFDSISLKLALPVDLLIRTSKLYDNTHAGLVFWISSLSLPSCFYLVLCLGGYGIPIFGRIFRHSDRLWQLYLLQAGVENWLERVPASVARRLCKADLARFSPSQQQINSQIRQERDLLMASLWMCIPIVFALLGLLGVTLFVLTWTLSLPFYLIRGNL